MITVRVKTKNNTVTLPQLTAAHCDLSLARVHPVLGQWVGKVMFDFKLHRYLEGRLPASFALDAPPPGVTVDTSEFLAVVHISV